jgi:hypothetical protein
MNGTERKLRHQGVHKLNQMKKDGAKSAIVEKLSRSISGRIPATQKGRSLTGRTVKPFIRRTK